MNTTTVAHPAAGVSARIVSIDIFRGLTMAVMIFVNALASIHGLPWWNYHAPAAVNAMTYPDFVFPFFLFAVGLSLPLAIARRRARANSPVALWLHVLERFLGLLVLGLFLANADKCNAAHTGINGNLWALLGLFSVALYLHVPSRTPGWHKLSSGLRWAGLAGAVLLLALFRRTTHAGTIAWLDSSYPEILGLIGFSYLGTCLLYLPTRRFKWAPCVWCLVMTILCVTTTAHWIPLRLSLWQWPFSNGSMCAFVFAGIAISSLLTTAPAARFAIPIALGMAALAFLAGWLLTPLGISKIRATPTWTLVSLGAAILLFLALHWLCDRRQQTRWAIGIHAAGSNTLLTYLLPDFWYFIFASTGMTFYDAHANAGIPGVVKTLLFTILMLALSSLLTRARLRLQL